MTKRRGKLIAAIVIGCATLPGRAVRADSLSDTYDIRLQVKVPMRDGVELNATLYLPKSAIASAPQRTPLIFTLTPYAADDYHERGVYFASHGYAFALVEARGRGNSGGEFVPFIHDAQDGFDTVEWFARQPFCDSHVAMWGGSYAGFDQWATAKELPPHLSTIVPAAAAYPGVDVPYYNNIGQPYLVQWLSLTNGRTSQSNLWSDQRFWAAKFLAAYRQHVPFASLDSFIGTPLPEFQHLLQHRSRDAFYDAVTPNAEQLHKITLPILTLTGQYDADELGALTYYREHFAHGNSAALAKHYLLIGPWDHGGTRTPADQTDGVKCGGAAVIDLNDLHRRWYDWTMRRGPKPDFLKKAVTYYELAAGNSGANGEWKYANNYSHLTADTQTYYLDSTNGDANGVFHSGRLTLTHPQAGTDSYTYDPLDRNRGELVDTNPDNKNSNLDQTYALSIGRDGLVYHTEPFEKEMELVGCPSLKLWLSLDAPDTDLEATLYEIQPDGTSIRLWYDIRRLRYRESSRSPLLVRPGEIVACDFNPGLFVARKLMKGSRLRLVVTSPNTAMQEKNYNSGGIVAAESARGARVAHTMLYHDLVHASALMQFRLKAAKEAFDCR